MFDVMIAVITPTHSVMGTVVVPRIMSRALSLRRVLCHGHYHCVAVVGVMLWLHLLRGCGGCCHAVFCVTGTVIAWLRWASCRMAAVGVTLRCHGGCCRAVFCITGAVIAWPWWASCRVAVVGVVAPY
jgi:hypothetical protein